MEVNVCNVASQKRMAQRSLSGVTLAVLSQFAWAGSDEVVFNDAFLRASGAQAHADLSIFSRGSAVMPGTYRVDIEVNGDFVEQRDIVFVASDDGESARPCVTKAMLGAWGVKLAAFPALAATADDACVDVTAVLPSASVSYDPGKLRLDVSLPQAALTRVSRGWVDPKLRDHGINAAMLDYQFSIAQSDGRNFNDNVSRNTVFAGLRGGINVGPWRFRHFSTYNQGLAGGGQWQAINTYAQRDIAPLSSQLVLGDGNTPGEIFDSIQFRGAQLATDDAMLPDSQRGYAPTVRGVANSAAKVTIRQNGYVIYSTYVAPGPFVIDDLYSTSGSGDLQVTVTEADGRETTFVQPFSALPVMMREGAWRYSATAGQYRSGYDSARPMFLQATATRGLSHGLTLYGGVNLASRYWAVLSGIGINLRDYGAFSLDVSHAQTMPEFGSPVQGQSFRFRYGKSFVATGTNFSVLGYRYSTRGYRTFAEAAQMQALQPGQSLYNRRSRIEGTVSQQLGSNGALFLTIGQQSYWGTSDKDSLVRLSYNGSYRRLNYGVYLDYNTYGSGPANKQVSFSLSIPLGRTGASAGYVATRNNQGEFSQQGSVAGSAFDDNRLVYGVYAGNSSRGGAFGSGTLSYLSPVGRLDLSRSQGRGYGQTMAGVAGGMVFHSGTVTLSQPLGETIAVVNAPGAVNADVTGYPGVMTNVAGQAVVPYVSPYFKNRIALDTATLGENVEIENAALEVVPTRGAVVLANFDTRVGHRVLFELKDLSGQPLPFGARVEDAWGREIGVVGPDGQTFTSGMQDQGALVVVWGKGDDQRCRIPYQIDEKTPSNGAFKQITATCEMAL